MKHAVIEQIEELEGKFLASIQELRAIKAALQKASSDSLEPLLTPEDVAEILKEPLSHVYSLARAKKLPSLKVGKYLKFSPASLAAWLKKREQH